MQKTYKCKNGHKFKKDEAPGVICPSCNEAAEPVKWKTVGPFTGTSKDSGMLEEVGSFINEIPGAGKAIKVFSYLSVISWIKKR